MKRCPACTRVFEDDSLTYCLDDGTPLVSERPQAPDSEATIVTPSPQAGGSGDLPATQYGRLPGKATVNGSQFQIPAMPTYRAAPQSRRVWPWVVAGVAALFLLVIVIGAVILIPMMARNSRNLNSGIESDAPSTASPSEASKPRPPDSGAAAPTDKDVVLSQLTELEKQWTQANVDGDKDAIQRILADEYSGGDPPHDKQEYLDTLKPDPSVKSWELQDLRVDLNGDRATVNGYLRHVTTRGTEVYGFTDKFVWRDGRWQAVGSRASRVK